MSKVKLTGQQFVSAKNYALNYLSFRPRSVKEIAAKLTEKGFEQEIISSVIQFLKEYKLVDDEAFASMWIRNRTKLKLTGRYRIKNELFQKGLSKEIIDSSLSELLPEDEEQMASLLVEKKLKNSEVCYRKLEAFLMRRGFPAGIIKRVLNKYSIENS